MSSVQIAQSEVAVLDWESSNPTMPYIIKSQRIDHSDGTVSYGKSKRYATREDALHAFNRMVRK